MTRNDFDLYLKGLFERLAELSANKGAEYAKDMSAFLNFEEGVDFSLHSEPESVAWEYACKHFQSIRNIIIEMEDGTALPNMEQVEEKVGDAIMYMALMEAMIYHRLESMKEAQASITSD